MANSLNTVQREIYTFIKKDKKAFYRLMFKSWGNRLYKANSHPEYQLVYDKNPELGAEVAIVYQSIIALGFENVRGEVKVITSLECEAPWLKIRPRFIKYLTKRVLRRKGVFPTETKTNALREFLARGFKHFEEVDLIKKSEWYISCTIAPLIWPITFKEQAPAIEISDKFGIPGYTSVKQKL